MNGNRLLEIFIDVEKVTEQKESNKKKKMENQLVKEGEEEIRIQIVQHFPYKEGKCADCHSFENENFLIATGVDLCFRCHQKEKFTAGENGQIHMPIRLGKCDLCHTPHESKEKALMKKPVLEVCSQCHKGIAQEFSHFPAEKGTCVSCHNPHGRNKEKKYFKGLEKEVCGACHSPESIKSDNPKKDFLASMYKMPACVSCHKAVIHSKK